MARNHNRINYSIFTENLLGHLCEEAGVKFSTGLFDNTTLAYSMTKEEAIQAKSEGYDCVS